MSAELRLELQGSPRFSLGDRPLTGFVSSKAQALLGYLAVTAGMHTRESLAGLLWGETPDADARASLRVVLSNLRQLLGPERLAITRQTVAFNRSSPYWLDVEHFEVLAGAHTPPGETLDGLRQAIQLYRGDLLEGIGVNDAPAFDEWLVVRREQLRQLALRTMFSLAVHDTASGHYVEGIEYLTRMLALDPWREDAHRQLMTLLVYSGQRGAALAQYERCRRMLADELGVEPEPDTVALHERIRAGQIQPAVAAHDALGPAHPIDAGSAALRSVAPHTSFVGRERELAQIDVCMRDPACRLLTLIGPGGIGKSRLAAHAAVEQRGGFRDGARVVQLAPVSAPEFIVPAIAGSLGVALAGPGDLTSQLLRYLRDRQLLLVLDNFEHLVGGATLLDDILAVAAGVKILVTSRERLALAAEWLIEVEGLTLPAGGRIEDIAASGAVRLFQDRARQARPGFVVADDNAASVTRICEILEGMPLGIELAAAWTRIYSCAEIESEIGKGLDFLASPRRDLPARHHSLRAVFEHSWTLLGDDEQRLFRALAVFRGGFTSAAAEAVAGASPADLRGLIDKSLLRRDASGRYVFHQLVRQYAAEQLAASPDSSAAHERHTGYYAGLLSDAASDLKGARQAESLRAVDADIDNVRAAWQWMVTNRSGALIARALDGLCLFYDLRGWLAEARMTLDLAVKTLKTDPAAAGRSTRDREIVMGRLLGWQARFEMIRGRFERSQVLVDESLAQLGRATAEHALAYGLDTRGMNANARGRQDEAAVLQQAALAAAESTDDRLGVSLAFNRLGGIAFDTGDFPQAKARFEQSLAVRREIGDWQGVARDYSNLGEVARLIGDFAEAHHRLRDSVALFRELGSNWRIVLPLENLGELSIVEGRLDDAEQHFRGALAIVRDIDEQRHLVLGTLGLGRVAWQRGDMQSAHQHLTESLAHARANGIRQGIVQCLNVRARLALGRDQMLDAERFGQESVALAAELGNHYALGVAELVLGRVALALKQFGDARRAIAASFTRLHATGARPAALDALTGLAELLMTAGARQPAGERAAELLAFVVTHPSAWHETRELAARCLDVLAVRLPEPALSASRARGAALTLDAPADAFLRSLGEAPE